MIPVQPGEHEAPQLPMDPTNTNFGATGASGGDAPLAERADTSLSVGAENTLDADAMMGLNETHKKRIPIETIVVAGALIIGAGVIYGMRTLGLGPSTGLANSVQTLKLPESSGSTADHTALLADLNAARTSRQVSPDNVKKNPFQLIGMALTPSSPAKDGEAESLAQLRSERERSAKAVADRKKALVDELRDFQLHGVMGGAQPVARINGDLYKVDDKVGKFYTLKRINSLNRSVELEADGVVTVLSLER